jgi:hypothetical protein
MLAEQEEAQKEIDPEAPLDGEGEDADFTPQQKEALHILLDLVELQA